ncbi:MAG: DUF4955 domain-containing protein [Ginsengibacter sp.]
MEIKIIFYAVLCIFIISCSVATKAQNNNSNPSKLFEQYKQNKENSILPDFSYAGYHNGEKKIPKIQDYKIFDVTQYGALPNDTISDKAAIQMAINAANKNGSGIVFFPEGRFLINEDADGPTSIVSNTGKIIFRGSGSGPGGTELYMKNPLPPKNPDQMWTVPPIIIFSARGKDTKIGDVVKSTKVGDFKIALNDTKNIKPGDWIVLSMLNNDPALLNAELAPYKASPAWTYLVDKGVDVKVYLQVAAVQNETITLKTPITYNIDPKYNWEVQLFANSEEVGIEHIAFVGSWKDKFVHHRSWKDDSGFTMFRFSRCTNSWMTDCRFTDCNVATAITQSANISIINCRITGNPGHEAIVSNESTNVLMAKLVDEASMWHSFGSSHGSMNTVIWRCSYPSTTCFESHASQPRNTLLDCVKGGLMQNRGGGALQNMPNHMKGLVIWNYTQTNASIKNFEFWPTSTKWWKIPNPIIVGFAGNGTTFEKGQVGYIESTGKWVTPNSLYEAQLALRLGQIPDWLKQLK